MPQIVPSQAYQRGSLIYASYVLLRQSNFPQGTYDTRDYLYTADSDRLLGHPTTQTRAQDCFMRHTCGSESHLGEWLRTASDEQIVSFLKDLFEADQSQAWTGYRIMTSVHPSAGTKYTLELFHKNPHTQTIVTTTHPHLQ
jgi:hypothetical protein